VENGEGNRRFGKLFALILHSEWQCLYHVRSTDFSQCQYPYIIEEFFLSLALFVFIESQASLQGKQKSWRSIHQYYGMKKALLSTIKAIGTERRAKVIWDTQGSGKIYSMVFLAGNLVKSEELKNPTIEPNARQCS